MNTNDRIIMERNDVSMAYTQLCDRQYMSMQAYNDGTSIDICDFFSLGIGRDLGRDQSLGSRVASKERSCVTYI